MVHHKVTDQGTVIATYRPAGELPPYPPEGPIGASSEREQVRQQKMKDGTW